MPKIEINIQEKLLERLEKFPEIDKSRIFQMCAEERLQIIDSLKKRIPNLSKEELLFRSDDIYSLTNDIKLMSYEFGQKTFEYYIRVDKNWKLLLQISFIDLYKGITIDELIDKLYKVAKNLEPINIFEDAFFEELFFTGPTIESTKMTRYFTLDCIEFIRGFIEAAKSTELMCRYMQENREEIVQDKLQSGIELICQLYKGGFIDDAFIVGSVAKGTAYASSDVDILILNPLFPSLSELYQDHQNQKVKDVVRFLEDIGTKFVSPRDILFQIYHDEVFQIHTIKTIDEVYNTLGPNIRISKDYCTR